MRIENILLKNYRQFKNVEIILPRKSENDLHIIIGKNGTGKTNLLNAINWCLYGDEPHLSKDSKQLPILNLNSIEETEDGEEKDVVVIVQVKTEDNRQIIFARKAIFRIYQNEKLPVHQHTEFEVIADDDKGNKEIFKDEEAKMFVERFVPLSIREFFFFDGERLDNYFREATVQNIRHAIYVITHIDLLENRT
jgi:DNA sulfur modification protein DndD